MKFFVIILLVSSINVKAQDTSAVKLLTDNISLQNQLILNQHKEIERQDKIILSLYDSLNTLNKKNFILSNQNGVLKKKNNKQELGFKIGTGVINLIILYLTSR